MILKEEKIKQAEELIDNFKKNFKEEIRANIIIKYTFNSDFTVEELPILLLEDLEKIINKFAQKENNLGLKDQIKITGNTRKWDFVKYKHIFYKLAVDMGYSCVEAGRYFGQNHATVINGKNKCINLLSYKDVDFTRIYNEIITYIKLIHTYEGDISNNAEE